MTATMEKFRLSLSSGPSQEPLSLQETKTFLRVDHNDEDSQISLLIQDARERAERVTGRQLVTATWVLKLSDFLPVIYLPNPPLQSVGSIQYIDTAGDTQTLATTEYLVDAVSEPGRITEAYSKTWPSVRAQMNAVTITYIAGYGTPSNVPAGLRSRLLAAVAHTYEHRESGVDEEYLDSLFRPWWMGWYV